MFTNNQANSANYATAGISLAILLIRLIIGRFRHRRLDLAFVLVVLSIIFVIARVVLNCFQLRLGTSNDAVDNPNYYKTHSLDDVISGSKVVLAARVAITCTLWLQVCLLLLFYGPILNGTRWVRHMIQLTWVTAALTFIAVTLITFLECLPISKLWQTQPKPNICAKAYKQLLSQCICNIILDVMLLIISFPILFHRGRNWSTNIRIGSLFMLGTFCIAVTIMRLTAVYGDKGIQAARTVWGAVQVIVATFVANAPVIYGDIRVVWRRRKEAETRRTTRSESWTGNRSVDVDVQEKDGYEKYEGGNPPKEISVTDGDVEIQGEKRPKEKSANHDLESLNEVLCVTSTTPEQRVQVDDIDGTAYTEVGIAAKTTAL